MSTTQTPRTDEIITHNRRVSSENSQEWYAKVESLLSEISTLKELEAESRRLFYEEQDRRQSAEYRIEELVNGLTDFATSSDPLISGIAKSIISRSDPRK